jgi:hypothetical protein
MTPANPDEGFCQLSKTEALPAVAEKEVTSETIGVLFELVFWLEADEPPPPPHEDSSAIADAEQAQTSKYLKHRIISTLLIRSKIQHRFGLAMPV